MTLAAALALDVTLGPGLALAMALLLAASFFFSGTETAFFSLQKTDLRSFTKEGATGSQLLWLLDRRPSLLATILIGNETVNVLFATLGAAVTSQLAPNAPWVNVLVVTPLLVLISEISPKVLALRFNRSWATLATWPITAVLFLVSPVRWLLSWVVGWLAYPLGVSGPKPADEVNEDELMVYVDRGAAAGTVDPMEREIIESVFEFDELTVDRCMSPRPDIFALPLSTPLPDLLRQCWSSGYSRVPIYRDRLDDIAGILLVKDLLRLARPGVEERRLADLLLPAEFVPGSRKADSMLQDFLERKYHMAFVQDEYGTLLGLITLDDLLGELIGQLDDEEDQETLWKDGPDQLRVKSYMDTEDFAAETGITLPEGEYNTVGGFVTHQLGRVPRRGQSVTHDGWEFVVVNMEGRRIGDLLVRRRPAEAQASA